MSDQDQPSLISGHAKYIQGTLSQALGYESGTQTKQDAISEMKAARDSSSSSDDNNNSTNKSSGGGGAPAQSSILGTVEKATGKITGCEGMVKEGEARMPRAGIEESNGTG